MKKVKRLAVRLDEWQQHQRFAAPTYGVVKKYSEDNANLHVVALGWYGFLAIFPLLLAVITIFGFIGIKSLGSTIVDTLHRFPVVGADFNPEAANHLHGSVIGLIVGLVGLLYGAQGVTQQAQAAMIAVWNLEPEAKPGFLPRLGRSFAGLAIIALTFLISAGASTYATASGEAPYIRFPVIAGLLVLNFGFYLAGFRVLTPGPVATADLVPGAMLGSIFFTLLTTVGTGLVNHQLRNASGTYGNFGSVIGLVTFLLLLARFSIYAAELNPVLARKVYPRSFLPEGFAGTTAESESEDGIGEAAGGRHRGVGRAEQPGAGGADTAC